MKLLLALCLVGAATAASSVRFVHKATGDSVKIAYNGHKLTVPQHCREETCAANHDAVRALDTKVDVKLRQVHGALDSKVDAFKQTEKSAKQSAQAVRDDLTQRMAQLEGFESAGKQSHAQLKAAVNALTQTVQSNLSNEKAAKLTAATKREQIRAQSAQGDEEAAQARDQAAKHDAAARRAAVAALERADRTLKASLDDESDARQQAIADVRSALDGTKQALEQADAHLHRYAVDAIEDVRRESRAADDDLHVHLMTELAVEASARSAADEELGRALSVEVAARAAADTALDQRVTLLKAYAVLEDAKLHNRIDAETAARLELGIALRALVSSSVETLQAEDKVIEGRVTTKIHALVAAEQEARKAAVAAEKQARQAADAALAADTDVAFEAAIQIAEAKAKELVEAEAQMRAAQNGVLAMAVHAERSERIAAMDKEARERALADVALGKAIDEHTAQTIAAIADERAARKQAVQDVKDLLVRRDNALYAIVTDETDAKIAEAKSNTARLIKAEEDARIAADAAEAAARQAAERLLAAEITDRKAAVEAARKAAADAVEAERKLRKAEDDFLLEGIVWEQRRREQADSALSQEIDANKDARVRADRLLESIMVTEVGILTAEVQRLDRARDSAVAQLDTARNDAVAKLENADKAVRGDLKTEAEDRKKATDALDQARKALETELKGADAELRKDHQADAERLAKQTALEKKFKARLIWVPTPAPTPAPTPPCAKGTYRSGFAGRPAHTLPEFAAYAKMKDTGVKLESIKAKMALDGVADDRIAAFAASISGAVAAQWQAQGGGCMACIPGRYSDQLESQSCTQCEEGTYAPGTRSVTCLHCAPGKSSLVGSSSCHACPKGKYRPEGAAPGRCIDCAGGQFQAWTGETNCVHCPVNTYQDKLGFHVCHNCPAGRHTDGKLGQLSCVDINECLTTPGICGGAAAAACTNHAGTYECSCNTGFEGGGKNNYSNQNSVKCTDIDECAPNNGAGPCQNNGICSDSTDDLAIGFGNHECVCPQGWEGTNCEVDTNECAANNGAGPCQNSGTCKESNTDPLVGIGNYQCVCPAGWYGTHCELDVNECAPNNGAGPCQNGATCAESSTDSSILFNDYKCTCGPGWKGKDCEVAKACTVAAPVNGAQVAGTIDCRNGAPATGTTGNCGCNCGANGSNANGFTNEAPASKICNDCAKGKGKLPGQGNMPDKCLACQYPNINAEITHSAGCAAQECAAGHGVTSDQGNWVATGGNCEACGAGYDSPAGSGQCQAQACTVGQNGTPGTINCQNGGQANGYTGTCTCNCAGTGFTGATCEINPFSMPLTTITNCGVTHGDQGPSASQCKNAYANTQSSFLQGVTMDSNYPGIQKFTVPANGAGTYRVKAYGPGGGQRWLNEIYGAGAIVQGDVQLTGGETLWVLVGQKSDYYKNGRNANSPYTWYKTYWTGGSGGTFVAKGSSLSTSTPLVVAGGGSGHRSSNEKDDRNSAEGHGTGQGTMDGWCHTYAQDAGTHGGSWNTAKVGQDTVSTSNNNLKLGFGHGGKGGYGGQGGNSGASGSPSNNLSSKSHTAGGGAGFYGDGRRSLDSRGGTTPVSAKSFRNGGRGGLFKPGYTNYSGGNWINGGFGGGGSGSWGGTGGAGGYSGGGGDPNSGFGGGGGSFCQPGTDGNPTDAANGCSCSWGSGTWTSSDTYINGAGNDHLGKVEITFISS